MGDYNDDVQKIVGIVEPPYRKYDQTFVTGSQVKEAYEKRNFPDFTVIVKTLDGKWIKDSVDHIKLTSVFRADIIYDSCGCGYAIVFIQEAR